VTTPLILSWPGRIEPAVVSDHLASYLDVFPTLLDYAAATSPRPVDGASLRPFAVGAPAEQRTIAFDAAYPAIAGARALAERDLLALFVRTPSWKYGVRDVEAGDDDRLRIQHLAVPFPERRAGAEELYDLERDPLERADLSADLGRQALLADLRARTLAWWRATGGGALPE
jgi:arylsulfatase A-like enzyme